MQYNPPLANPGTGGAYIQGNAALGVAGSVPPAAGFEVPQREIVNVLTEAGLTPSGSDNTQLAQAIGILGGCSGTDTSSSGNIVTVSTTLPAQTALAAGQLVLITKGSAPNTGAVVATVLTSTGAVTWANGNALAPGDW